MARVPYDSGAGLVAPETLAPRDLQHEQATPNAFGGAIAQGGEDLGEGALAAVKYFGQVQTDSVTNNYLKEGNALVEHAQGLKGQDYLDAQEGINKQLDDLTAHYRGQLALPGQQLQFDSQTRPYRDRLWAGKLATYGQDAAYTFGKNTNNDAIGQAADMAASNFNNPAFVAVQAQKARQYSYRQVQLDGQENNPDAVNEAAQRGSALVYKSAAQAMAVKDPVGARAFVDAHQADLGAEYGPLAEQIRGRAEQQTGISAGQQAFQIGSQGRVSPASPLFTQAAAAAPGGMSAEGLARTAQIESGFNPTAVNGHAHGLFQFEPATWAQFGQGSPFDATAAATAAAKLSAANAVTLTQALGRQPTDAELYVAHQQGAGGAVKLLENPNARAGDLVGDAAIRANGGDPNAPASAFTSMWIAKFGGHGVAAVTPGAGQPMTLPLAADGAPNPAEAPVPPPTAETPEAPVAAPGVPTLPGAQVPPTVAPAQPVALSPQAVAYQHIDDLVAQGKLNANEAQHARETVNQMVYADQVSTAQTVQARRQAANEASNEYLTRMMKGDMGNIIPEIANDPRFASDPDAKRALWDLALKKSGDSDPAIYGSGFNNVYQRILAAPGDPKRISDPVDILKLGAAGGPLTFAGTQKALTILNETKKSVDGYGVQATKAGAVDNAKRYLSFEQDDGFVKIRDPEGEKIFDTQFLPRFESAFDDWTVRQGKDPHDFPLFDPKKMDAMLQQLRPKRERDAARMAALGDDVASAPQAAQPAPPAPADVDPDGWNATMRALPYGVNGQPWPVAQWASVVETLRADPTPKTIESFNRHFGAAGFDANEILRQLKPQAQAAPLPGIAYGGGD